MVAVAPIILLVAILRGASCCSSSESENTGDGGLSGSSSDGGGSGGWRCSAQALPTSYIHWLCKALCDCWRCWHSIYHATSTWWCSSLLLLLSSRLLLLSASLLISHSALSSFWSSLHSDHIRLQLRVRPDSFLLKTNLTFLILTLLCSPHLKNLKYPFYKIFLFNHIILFQL